MTLATWPRISPVVLVPATTSVTTLLIAAPTQRPFSLSFDSTKVAGISPNHKQYFCSPCKRQGNIVPDSAGFILSDRISQLKKLPFVQFQPYKGMLSACKDRKVLFELRSPFCWFAKGRGTGNPFLEPLPLPFASRLLHPGAFFPFDDVAIQLTIHSFEISSNKTRHESRKRIAC